MASTLEGQANHSRPVSTISGSGNVPIPASPRQFGAPPPPTHGMPTPPPPAHGYGMLPSASQSPARASPRQAAPPPPRTTSYPYSTMYPPPPPPPHAYPYGYSPYGPPPPSGGYYSWNAPPPPPPPPPPNYYGGYYPPQYPAQSARPPASAVAPPSSIVKPHKSSDPSPPRKPGSTAADIKSSDLHPKVLMDVEQQRILAAADPIEVEPMRSDFSFFCADRYELVEREAQQQIGDEEAKDLYLLASNMNNRFIKAWEGTDEKTREQYFGREENDRKRFMDEDEIASRHCATLTARSKSPDELEQEPLGEGQEVEPNVAGTPKKRASPTIVEDASESPSKRKRKTEAKPDRSEVAKAEV